MYRMHPCGHQASAAATASGLTSSRPGRWPALPLLRRRGVSTASSITLPVTESMACVEKGQCQRVKGEEAVPTCGGPPVGCTATQRHRPHSSTPWTPLPFKNTSRTSTWKWVALTCRRA